jgi:hypothetical protein
MVHGKLEGGGCGPLGEKRTPCLSTPLVFFHGYRGGPQGVVYLGGGLGYRVLICRPIQGCARGLDMKCVASPGVFIFQFPLVESLPTCAVLLESSRQDAIHAIRQIRLVPPARFAYSDSDSLDKLLYYIKFN